MIGYYILIGIIALVSWAVSARLKSKFEQYSKVALRNGMSGAEIAEKMLADHGIRDVRVISTPGRLTDHYNPADKTVNLSEAVYNERNAAAAAVAAHEVGHAVQHATAYEWLNMRSKLVPMVNISSGMSQWLIIGGLILGAASGLGFGYYIAIAGLVLMAITTLFTFITLPVEYDASNRALAWLKNKNMLSQQEYAGSEDALKWAARTYLVAAIGALASLLYWALQVFGGSRD
ncbi:Zn-dependent membrane protease YugP [Flavobacterium arsenatis]|uniref:Zn-dependent membrane protease YugP n=1 Tax=Flavobacterium arsenatis TaxID=1484332 RepID=A0ABU1TKU6_9FLAO|nr:zinc metallopeptidase [Flavobacterium arsenatis]MDR6966604.1 Zn-dependent membrane protease YugP [Flavobacterium arsenatis]